MSPFRLVIAAQCCGSAWKSRDTAGALQIINIAKDVPIYSGQFEIFKRKITYGYLVK